MLQSKQQRRSLDWHPRMLAIGAAAAALSSVHCGSSSPDGSGGNGGSAPVDRAICHAPASVSGAPQTIEEVTALINALAAEHQGTVELPCFVASLDRPLGATASSGYISAQPAHGARSPRMFLWSGDLVLSVVPEGIGKDLLELGLQTSPTRSIKAEIAFPVTAHLSDSAPYDRLLDEGNESRCRGCHAGETLAPSVTWAKAFESDVLRPTDDDMVPVSDVELENKSCDPAAEPQRCALLGAIFDQGGLQSKAFSREALTIFGD
jgi:hypothetical protein